MAPRWLCFGETQTNALRHFAALTPRDRAEAMRRLRLEHASGGDREHAAGVARMIEQAAHTNRMRAGQ